MATGTAGRTRYYRAVFRLLGGYVLVLVAGVGGLLLSITDANAGYPALFFGGVLLGTSPAIGAVLALLAGLSLKKHEPYRGAMILVLVLSCLVIGGSDPSLFASSPG